jgi:hypothetical protein
LHAWERVSLYALLLECCNLLHMSHSPMVLATVLPCSVAAMYEGTPGSEAAPDCPKNTCRHIFRKQMQQTCCELPYLHASRHTCVLLVSLLLLPLLSCHPAAP